MKVFISLRLLPVFALTSIKKWLCSALLMLPMVAAQAADGQSAEAAIQADIQTIKQSVLQLNKDLYALEDDLLSPATTRAAFYLSLAHGEFFEPLSIEIKAKGMLPVQHIYTERQVQALRLGAVQPLANVNLGPGQHQLRAVIRGVDHLGQNRELVIEQNVEKSDQPLLLEIVIRDDAERSSAQAQLNHW